MKARSADLSPTILILAALFGAVLLGWAPGTSAIPATVGVSYVVFGGGTGYGAPTFSYTSNGHVQSLLLTRNQTLVTLDTGSPWSVSAVLPGSNLTVRWATKVTSGIASPRMLSNFSYYRQADVQLSFLVIGGGHPLVQVNSTAFGISNPNRPAGGSTWLDLRSFYSYQRIVLSTITGERWAAPVSTNGTILGPSTLSATYFHQYLIMADYTSSWSSPLGTPLLSGTTFGRSVSINLTTAFSLLWLDAQSQYQVTPAFYLSSTERWALGTPSGTISAPLVLTSNYFHQYTLSANYEVIGGSSPGQPLMQYSSGGSVVFSPLSQTSVQFWADAGTTYGLPLDLPGSSSTERWILKGPQWSPLISSASKVSPTYYHQYALRLNHTLVGNGSFSSPTMTFVSMGLSNHTTLNGEAAWADSGTSIAVTRSEAGPTSDTMWVLGTQIPATAVSPLTSNAVYYLQAKIQFTFQVQGGGNPPAPVFTFVSLGIASNTALSSNSTFFWADNSSAWSIQSTVQGATGERWALQHGASAGKIKGPFALSVSYQHEYLVQISAGKFGGGKVTNSTGWYTPGRQVELFATASVGWEFGEWVGNPSITANPVSVIVNGPVMEDAVFYPGVAVNVGSGGTVTVVSELISGKATPTSPFVIYVHPGTQVTVYATSNRFYQFVGWSGSESGNQNPLTFGVTGPTQVNAGFAVPITSYIILVAGVSLITVGGYFALRLFMRLRKGPEGEKWRSLKFGRR